MVVKQGVGSSLETGNHFHQDYTTTNLYVERSFGFPAKRLSLVNDSDTDPAQISFDGATLHYTLKGGEFVDIAAGNNSSVFVKATTGGEKVRITAT